MLMEDYREEKEQLKETVRENLRNRIAQIMHREGLKAGEFADSINVAQATISQILKGRNMPSMDIVLRLHQRYPDICLDWLLTGKGKMSVDDNGVSSDSSTIEMTESSYPLFAENTENATEGTKVPENRKDFKLERPINNRKDIVHQEIIYKERPPRKITEIRIFFDDNTYETFKPA